MPDPAMTAQEALATIHRTMLGTETRAAFDVLERALSDAERRATEAEAEGNVLEDDLLRLNQQYHEANAAKTRAEQRLSAVEARAGHWCLEPVVVERDALQAMWHALDDACPHVASALRAAHQSAVRPLLPGGKSDQGEKEKP